MKLQHEEVMQRTIKTLINDNELNRPDSAEVRSFSDKSYINIHKVDIFHVLHHKVALLAALVFLSRKPGTATKQFLERFRQYI